jgi:hypothetical protein
MAGEGELEEAEWLGECVPGQPFNETKNRDVGSRYHGGFPAKLGHARFGGSFRMLRLAPVEAPFHGPATAFASNSSSSVRLSPLSAQPNLWTFIGSSIFLCTIVSAMFIGVNSGAPTTELDREALGRR